jgi:hypothetical protein
MPIGVIEMEASKLIYARGQTSWEQSANRQRAVKFFEEALTHILNQRAMDHRQKRKPINEFDITMKLPIRVAQLVLESARDSQYLGRKARPLHSHTDEMALRNAAAWARERETGLRIEGRSGSDSEQQALEEARVKLLEEYDIDASASTIKRW